MALFSRLTLGLAWLAALLFVAAGAILSYEVGARYLFVRPTVWAAELSQLCLIWGCLLAMPWLLGARRHIAVDALVPLLPRRAQCAAEALAMAAVAAFSGVVAWKGAEIFLDSFTRGRTTGSMLDLPIWIAEGSVPLGFSLLTVQALIELARALRGDPGGPAARHPE